MQGQALSGQIILNAAIGHHRADNTATGKRPLIQHGTGKAGQQLVAIQDRPCFIRNDQPVGITIQRNTHIGAMRHNRSRHDLRVNSAAPFIDVETIGFGCQRNHLGAKVIQHIRRGPVGGTIGAVDNHLDAVKSYLCIQCGFGKFHIAPHRIQHAAGPPQLGGLRQCDGPGGKVGYAGFHRIRQLGAIGAEQFDAIIMERVMACRNHHANIGAQRLGKIGNAGCRHWAQQPAIHADRGESGNQRCLDHIARNARILANHDHGSALAIRVAVNEPAARCQRQPHNGFGGHRPGIDTRPHPVCTEQACHGSTAPVCVP